MSASEPTPAGPNAGPNAVSNAESPSNLERLTRVRVVLVETSLSANIGAVARAMKTMGLSQLVLVRPQQQLDADALARAAGADDLLASARICDGLTEALAGCRLVIGSSARARALAWPEVDPAGAARHLLDEAAVGEVALLLGRERSGLTNDELACCHYLTRIPANPDYSSLNIAAAAQVFAYELRRCALMAPVRPPARPVGDGLGDGLGDGGIGQAAPSAHSGIAAAEGSEAPDDELATADEMAGFYAHLEQTLVAIGFADPSQSVTLRRRLRRLFNRARPDRTELNILRGILSAAAGRKHPDRFRR